jgi:hypothetical protein
MHKRLAGEHIHRRFEPLMRIAEASQLRLGSRKERAEIVAVHPSPMLQQMLYCRGQMCCPARLEPRLAHPREEFDQRVRER